MGRAVFIFMAGVLLIVLSLILILALAYLTKTLFQTAAV